MSLIEGEGIVVQPSPVCAGYKRVREKPVTGFNLSALLLDQLQRPGFAVWWQRHTLTGGDAGQGRCGTDEIPPPNGYRVEGPARSRTKGSLTIPRGERSSIRPMIGLRGRCIGENS
jgi:hypothetical protein